MIPGVRESDILLAVRDLLAMRGFKVWRQNAGSHPVKGGFARLAPRGSSDLIGYHKGSGRALCVEVKRPGKKPSQEQQQWLQEAFEAGCVAFWCDSVAMAEAELRRYGL